MAAKGHPEQSILMAGFHAANLALFQKAMAENTANDNTPSAAGRPAVHRVPHELGQQPNAPLSRENCNLLMSGLQVAKRAAKEQAHGKEAKKQAKAAAEVVQADCRFKVALTQEQRAQFDLVLAGIKREISFREAKRKIAQWEKAMESAKTKWTAPR